MKRFLMVVLVLTLMVLGACGKDSADDNGPNEPKEQENNPSLEISDDEKVNEDEVIANINGTEITGNKYNLVYVQIKMTMNQLGEDTSDKDTLKDLAVDVLVNQEILKQDAKAIGINVTEDELEAEYDAYKAANEEQFADLLEPSDSLNEALKDQAFFKLIHDKYLDSEIPAIEVTDKEIKEIYDQLKKENSEIPEFKDAKDQLRNELTAQKEQEKMQERVEELKKETEVETMI